MNSRVLRLKHGPTILVRPLRNGDIDTVLALFHRLDEPSRRRRFNGAKARLTEDELWQLARADGTHHALVAYIEGDRDPVAIAHLVRDGRSAEIAFEVADAYQQRGIGSALTEELLADARAAGITEITALVAADNPAAVALLRRTLAALEISFPRTGAVDPRRHTAFLAWPRDLPAETSLGQLARLDRQNVTTGSAEAAGVRCIAVAHWGTARTL